MSRKKNLLSRKLGHSNDQVLLQRATLHHTRGQIEKAELLYSKLLVSDPLNANALYLLGVVNIQKQKYEVALGLLERSLEINPSNISAHYNHGLALQSLFKHGNAEISYLTALQINPNHISSLTNLGSVYMYLENFSAAEEVFRKLMILTERDVNTLNNLGMCLFRRRKFETAISYLTQAYQQNPMHAEVNNNLGVVLQTQGEFDKALYYYEKAISINENYGAALNNLGSLYWQTNELDRSVEIYSKAARQKKVSLVAHTALSLFAWLKSDLVSLAKHLNDISSADYSSYSKNQKKFIKGYSDYLNALAHFAKNEPTFYNNQDELPVIHVVGDSHCLSFHNLVVLHNDVPHRCKARLIVGCKAWSLANGEHNQYKQAFVSILEDISENEKVIFSFGEIDCRLDEGIIPYCEKFGLQAVVEARKLASQYFEFLRKSVASRSLRAFIFGVPRPLKSNNATQMHLNQVILTFNKTLADASDGEPNLSKLDSYALADQRCGEPYHIDGVHLHPRTIMNLF